jgi:hypothetical protein
MSRPLALYSSNGQWGLHFDVKERHRKARTTYRKARRCPRAASSQKELLRSIRNPKLYAKPGEGHEREMEFDNIFVNGPT